MPPHTRLRFAWELPVILLLFLLLPAFAVAHETGPFNRATQLESLKFLLTCLAVMGVLSISVIRNQHRSKTARATAIGTLMITIALAIAPLRLLWDNL